MSRLILLAALALFASATSAMAQRPATGAAPVDSSAAALPTLSIGGRVTIEELRVNADPRVEVNLRGCPLLEEVRIDERTNLPDPVVAGVYRDVVIEAHAAVVLADSVRSGECLEGVSADSAGTGTVPR